MHSTRLALFALSAALTLTPLHAQSWHVASTFHPGGEGGWDYVTVDAPNQRLFVTRSTHTQAIDTRTGKLLADIPGGSSNLGPALRSSEGSDDPTRPRLLVIATDMELFDPDPGAVARLITNNSATKTLLLVLNNPAPQFLDGTAVEAVQIQPNTSPAAVAEIIVRAAQHVVEASHPKGDT